MSHTLEEMSAAESSESPCEQKNQLAREAHARRAANETNKKSEQCRSAQRQAYTRWCENETSEEAEYCRKKQNEANKHTSNLACIDNYDTTAVISHSEGLINVE
ncbi:32012_t:CDS:2, partial [Racocetra persica]